MISRRAWEFREYIQARRDIITPAAHMVLLRRDESIESQLHFPSVLVHNVTTEESRFKSLIFERDANGPIRFHDLC